MYLSELTSQPGVLFTIVIEGKIQIKSFEGKQTFIIYIIRLYIAFLSQASKTPLITRYLMTTMIEIAVVPKLTTLQTILY